MKTNRKSLIAIAAIVVVVFTAMFLVVDVTALFVTAYIFALVGVAAVLYAGLYLLKTPQSYPWAAAMPTQTLRWSVIEVIISAGIVLLEQIGVFVLPLGWFVLIQIAVLAFFAVRVVMLNAGRVEIERVDDKVRANTINWKALALDVEALAARSPEVKPLVDAIRYSDPVTSPKLAEYDAQIRNGVTAIEQAVNSGGDVGERVATLLRQIKDRNNRAKILK